MILSSGVFIDTLVGMLTSALFVAFVVIVLGYMLGRINIKGVELGSSGVFIAALIVGIIIAEFGENFGFDKWQFTEAGKTPDPLKSIATIRNLGLGMFVAGIGFIAGPSFIRNFRSKALSYLAIGSAIIFTATITCIIILAIDRDLEVFQALGIMMGALSTTPGLSAAQGVFPEQSTEIAALSGLTYPFGVLGVVLFVQFIPKLLKADMAKEIQKLKGTLSSSSASDEVLNKSTDPSTPTPANPNSTMNAAGSTMNGAGANGSGANGSGANGSIGSTMTGAGANGSGGSAMNASGTNGSGGSAMTGSATSTSSAMNASGANGSIGSGTNGSGTSTSSATATANGGVGKKLIKFDSLGMCIFGLAVAIGMVVGSITIPLGDKFKFSLGTTGGALLTGLLFAHFGKVGRVSLQVPMPTLKVLRELGLIFFLTCSGIEGGFKFLDQFQPQFLVYGMILTIIPLVAGYLIARYAFKLELLNNLGGICGGMTSTPALGALIHVSKTEEVAQSYAATYPIALLLLVFTPQLIALICT